MQKLLAFCGPDRILIAKISEFHKMINLKHFSEICEYVQYPKRHSFKRFFGSISEPTPNLVVSISLHSHISWIRVKPRVVLEKTLESPLDCREIQPVHPKGNQSWISIGRTDAEAEAPILWPPDAKTWLIETDPDAAIDWRQEEKGMTQNEMVGWRHWLNGHEFE